MYTGRSDAVDGSSCVKLVPPKDLIARVIRFTVIAEELIKSGCCMRYIYIYI